MVFIAVSLDLLGAALRSSTMKAAALLVLACVANAEDYAVPGTAMRLSLTDVWTVKPFKMGDGSSVGFDGKRDDVSIDLHAFTLPDDRTLAEVVAKDRELAKGNASEARSEAIVEDHALGAQAWLLVFDQTDKTQVDDIEIQYEYRYETVVDGRLVCLQLVGTWPKGDQSRKRRVEAARDEAVAGVADRRHKLFP